MNVFDLVVGNGRLLAWTTTQVTIGITIRIGTYARSLVIVIDLASLLRDNEHISSQTAVARKRTKMP
jgi:hypothetical protein